MQFRISVVWLFLCFACWQRCSSSPSQNGPEEIEARGCSLNETLTFIHDECPSLSLKGFEMVDCVALQLTSLLDSFEDGKKFLCLALELQREEFVDDCHWIIHAISQKIFDLTFENRSLSEELATHEYILQLIQLTRQVMYDYCLGVCRSGCRHTAAVNYVVLSHAVCEEELCDEFVFGFGELCSIYGTRHHACRHGIGHGLYRVVRDLDTATQFCLQFDFSGYCIEGLVMEYIHDLTLSSDNLDWVANACRNVPRVAASRCAYRVGEGLMYTTEHDLQQSYQLCEELLPVVSPNQNPENSTATQSTNQESSEIESLDEGSDTGFEVDLVQICKDSVDEEESIISKKIKRHKECKEVDSFLFPACSIDVVADVDHQSDVGDVSMSEEVTVPLTSPVNKFLPDPEDLDEEEHGMLIPSSQSSHTDTEKLRDDYSSSSSNLQNTVAPKTQISDIIASNLFLVFAIVAAVLLVVFVFMYFYCSRRSWNSPDSYGVAENMSQSEFVGEQRSVAQVVTQRIRRPSGWVAVNQFDDENKGYEPGHGEYKTDDLD